MDNDFTVKAQNIGSDTNQNMKMAKIQTKF